MVYLFRDFISAFGTSVSDDAWHVCYKLQMWCGISLCLCWLKTASLAEWTMDTTVTMVSIAVTVAIQMVMVFTAYLFMYLLAVDADILRLFTIFIY